MRREGSSESGQAVVETAIVMPLFVFLLLGILQLGLMHQARLLTKYAAYKAVRAGALHNARIDVMERAALAVLMPMLSRDIGGVEQIKPVLSDADYREKRLWSGIRNNLIPESGSLKYAEVTICNPVQEQMMGRNELDFDDPDVAASSDWRDSQRTKLVVQVTFNYRMPIPFANMIIHRIASGQEVAWIMRMGEGTVLPARNDEYARLAREQKLYVLPIRANYAMRMQSNIYVTRAPIPQRNECVIPFNKL